ncbi:MAG TPA: ABC transporter ATP-binding protein [Mycobacteriales bacterium]|nr:ABC transporter ATP-binding protein [Mycobacteriales bacterium]
MADALLTVRSLEVSFGKAQVLAGVDLDVESGETLAVVGPNGAGKTTLLRALSRLNDATFGEATFAGRPLPASPYGTVMAGLVHCPERRRLFPGLTVRDNLELGARRLRKDPSTREEDLARVFALFPRLGERQKQAAGTLSGGEQQQCAIGRALMARPLLLMLDEPSLGLSVGIKEAIVASLQTIKDAGTTMLLVEQDVGFAFRCADRAVVLEHGTVALEGPVAKVAADPYVKQAYLGVA